MSRALAHADRPLEADELRVVEDTVLGISPTETAKKCGHADGRWTWTVRQRPHVAATILEIRRQNQARALDILENAGPKAAATLIALLGDKQPGHVRLAAAIEILKRVAPQTAKVDVTVSRGNPFHRAGDEELQAALRRLGAIEASDG